MEQAKRAHRKSAARILRPREEDYSAPLFCRRHVQSTTLRKVRGNEKGESGSLAPQPGLEPGTLRLTAECSTIELLRSKRTQTLSAETALDFITHAEKPRQQAAATLGRQ